MKYRIKRYGIELATIIQLDRRVAFDFGPKLLCIIKDSIRTMTPIPVRAITSQGFGAMYVIPTVVDNVFAADGIVFIGVPSGNSFR